MIQLTLPGQFLLSIWQIARCSCNEVRINHVMVGFFVPRQTGAFVEPVFAESTSAKQVV
jgi:hypothetical protein